jgi:hypothetical protein
VDDIQIEDIERAEKTERFVPDPERVRGKSITPVGYVKDKI